MESAVGPGAGGGPQVVLRTPVCGLEEQTFQEWVVRTPRSAGGLGLRRQTEVVLAAFVGGVELALPSFAESKGGGLAQVVGTHSFQPDNRDTRWSSLVSIGVGEGAGRVWGPNSETCVVVAAKGRAVCTVGAGVASEAHQADEC